MIEVLSVLIKLSCTFWSRWRATISCVQSWDTRCGRNGLRHVWYWLRREGDSWRTKHDVNLNQGNDLFRAEAGTGEWIKLWFETSFVGYWKREIWFFFERRPVNEWNWVQFRASFVSFQNLWNIWFERLLFPFKIWGKFGSYRMKTGEWMRIRERF
jgi:hypothetical protein